VARHNARIHWNLAKKALHMKLAILMAMLLTSAALADDAGRSFRIPDTGQTRCYDARRTIPVPQPGEAFFGQDAQSPRHPLSYTLSADGLTVHDNNTNLTWQRSPRLKGTGTPTRDDKLTFAQAKALPVRLNANKFGGFDDWRLPTIKELYSLINFNGTDPPPMDHDTSHLTPFIDTKYFTFSYGNPDEGERIIDSQYASSTLYVGKSFRGYSKLFGVNFADGRIKGYDLMMPFGDEEKTFFVICVRGNRAYGKNDFHDDANGIITDRASGLSWAQNDSGTGMDWPAALAWVQQKNAQRYLGRTDWRLPNAKELQSIVDYTRCPDVTDSPAIDPIFHCTPITNENGQKDFAYYWTSTTHGSSLAGGGAVYIAFGRAAGWPSGPPGGLGPDGDAGGQSGNLHFVDVHGAGAQRSDPKVGDPSRFPHGRGPQGDVVRINNFVRLVRGG
jgi:hypothetical protein